MYAKLIVITENGKIKTMHCNYKDVDVSIIDLSEPLDEENSAKLNLAKTLDTIYE